MNDLIRTVGLTNNTKLERALEASVESGSAFLGGMVQGALGDPTPVQNVPGDVLLGTALLFIPNPLSRCIGRGLITGALGRGGHNFGQLVHTARRTT